MSPALVLLVAARIEKEAKWMMVPVPWNLGVHSCVGTVSMGKGNEPLEIQKQLQVDQLEKRILFGLERVVLWQMEKIPILDHSIP